MSRLSARTFAVVVASVAAVATSLGATACKDEPLEERPPDPVPSAPPLVRPVDHLAPNELLEGSDTAFGLKLPRDARVDHSFPTIVYASTLAPLDPVVEYFRVRVRDGSFRKSQYSSTFEHVKAPARPGFELEIVLRESPGVGTTMELRDTTPPEQPHYANEEAEWRGAGLLPGGKLLDPQKLE